MVELDITRAPRGVLAAQLLVSAVSEQGDQAERHYLELKSHLDLATKKDKEKIAKFILGAANRMPEIANSAFEGYAAMVIGVAKDEITGIAPVEMMEIAKVVQQFVGAAGPRWDVVWVPIHGSTNQVLIVLVDPPVDGQGPFPCRSSGVSIYDGRIYIRVEGETREASADELDLLIRRGSIAPKVEVDFAVELIGVASPVAVDDTLTVDEYLRRMRTRLLRALPAGNNLGDSDEGSKSFDAFDFEALSPGIKTASFLANAMLIPEDRTESAYRASVHLWEEQFRDAWDAAIRRIATSQMTPVMVRLINRTTTYFEDVELKLHLAGEVFAHEYEDPNWANDLIDLGLPRPPRLWGPQERTLNIPNYLHMMPSPAASPSHFISPSVRYRNSGSVDLDLEVGELRPLGQYESEDEEFVLLVGNLELESIRGNWQLTARDHHEVYKGEITVPVAKAVDITERARQILMLDSDED